MRFLNRGGDLPKPSGQEHEQQAHASSQHRRQRRH